MRLSGQIANELGQGIIRRAGSDGFVAETTIGSSRPGIEPYRMLRSLGGYWMHADARCMGFLQHDHCQHVDAAEERENRMSEAQDLVVYTNPLALTERITVEDILEGFHAVGEWRYSFRRKGQEIEGLSADGVQDGVRQMARKGEAIRTLEVHLERETDREAFFVARAGRYAIAPDGRELLLDTTIRGKRVAKYEVHSSDDQYGKWKKGQEYLNEDWFEHGVTKAARNAEEALMPEALKQWMITAARAKAQKPTSSPQQPRGQQQRRTPPANVNATTGEIIDSGSAPSSEPTEAPTQESTEDPGGIGAWWAETRRQKLDRKAVLTKSQEIYGREPADLDPAELQVLLEALRPAQAAMV